jgi:hypothetical protein
MMANKVKAFVTDTLEVVYGHLHRPDDKFGADSANHNVTVLVDDQLQRKLDELQQDTNVTKINGMRQDDEGRTLLKVKSKLYVKDGGTTFPCRDANSAVTEASPFGGDKVRLRLNPAILDRDNSMSIYLNGCQIVEKNAQDTGGFSKVENGFDGSTFKVEKKTDTPEVAAETDEIPF